MAKSETDEIKDAEVEAPKPHIMNLERCDVCGHNAIDRHCHHCGRNLP